MQIFYIGLFGAFGCLSRYAVSGWTYTLVGRGLPYGTLGITTGFMGGFTTFSTFSYETFRLFEDGSYLAAGANIVLNIVICLVFAGLGISLAKRI
ncbi:MAG: CrcB family protein [Desulfuromonadales bacterium]